MKKREKKWLRKHLDKLTLKAYDKRRKQVAREYATSRRNSVFALVNDPGFTIPQLIELTKERFPNMRESYRLNEAITEMIKDGTLIIDEYGYVDRNHQREYKKMRADFFEQFEAERGD